MNESLVLIADPDKILKTLDRINGTPNVPYIPTEEEELELEKTDYLVKFQTGDKVWHVYEWFSCSPNEEESSGAKSDLVEILDHKVVRDFGNPSRGVLYYVKQPFIRKLNYETCEESIVYEECKFWTHQCGLYSTKEKANNASL